MLQQRKYISNPIVPQENVEARFGKKIVMQNCGTYIDENKNAGVVCNRITELNINSRKKISNVNSDSSQMKDALNHADHKPVEVFPAKRPLISYSTYDNQQQFFETKLVPDTQGKMSICVGRKSGSATVNINIDEYDLEKTYHTWKRIMGKSAPHNKSNLENDRFLTVSEDAKRSDKLPIIKNRNPPYANPDGPFERERLNLPKQARDNLDRTLTPRSICEKTCLLKKNNEVHKDSFFLSSPQGETTPNEIKGVRRTNFPWINSNRIKKILAHHYENGIEDEYIMNNNKEKCENNHNNNCNFQNNYINEENAVDYQREVNYNVSNDSQYGKNNYNSISNIHYINEPSYNNMEYNEEKYNSNLHNYKNEQNYHYQYKDDNQKNYEDQQYYNNQQYQNNEANCEYQNFNNHSNYENQQNCNSNQIFNFQYNNENNSHFGNYDKNLDNIKYNYPNNEPYCCNKGDDCCNNCYEYINNTLPNKDEDLNNQKILYRAPSLTEIS
ncbi:thioredoxin-like associated protein 1, putative [Plasmodium gallinaceum]|uniref:Thioredoxin-like associated protein 1, putative n=1 Tax=Plasmodium gallinaceum TaxID=5849 RepID=A0A1J1H087_PLAGA|nr:thioredoxin-like associated protein 1, putative [Plasmodium gallinaceum]CRG96938.1 thioredoxin-like associated protein 1, putative [Plasmodium gallinaceum]